MVKRVKRDGSVSWLTQDPIAPNDLCFGPDGWLYVTDPTRDFDPRTDGRLFRVNIETGECQLICTVDYYPNGIGFGPDDALYVANCRDCKSCDCSGGIVELFSFAPPVRTVNV